MVFVHPEVARRLSTWASWSVPSPFDQERGRFARNPYTLCSCLLCKWSKRVEPRRGREWRDWKREVDVDLEERGAR
jgi:hypothetical protein